MNRDFRLANEWQERSYVFTVPADGTNDFVRFGQWQVKGRIAFDEVELEPVLATHTRLADGSKLGEAESIRDGVYRFSPKFGWMGANFHRPLFVNRAGYYAATHDFTKNQQGTVYEFLSKKGLRDVNGRTIKFGDGST